MLPAVQWKRQAICGWRAVPSLHSRFVSLCSLLGRNALRSSILEAGRDDCSKKVQNVSVTLSKNSVVIFTTILRSSFLHRSLDILGTT